MAAALTPVSLESSKHASRRVYSVALSGNYVTGGDTLNFKTASNSKGIDGVNDFWNNPDYAGVVNIPGPYKAEVIPGATPAAYLLKIYDLTNAGAELAQAGYPAALLAATPPTSPVTVEIGHAKSNR